MRLQTVVFAALVGLMPGRTRAADPAVPVKAIDAVVAAEMKKQRVPGVAVAVVHKGEVVAAKGYGEANVEHRVPTTAETIFQSGSLGKQFTAAAVMLLVEDGKLALEDPVTTYLPGAPEGWKRITVRHLLTHTSGIPDYADDKFDYRKDYTEAELAKMAFGLKLAFESGARWRYSNTGYVLLGCIVRKASGQFYGDVLRDRVFRPLGMKTAHTISEEDIVPNRASGYRLVEGKLKNQEWVSPSLNTTADGSLYLSVRDLIAWDKGVREKAILKPESWEKVFTPAILKSGKSYPYGFGWSVENEGGRLRHSHGGAWQGFTTHISRFRTDDLTVIVLTNLAHADPDDIAGAVAALFNPKLAPKNGPIPDADPAITKRLTEILGRAREGKLTREQYAYDGEGYSSEAAATDRKLLEKLGPLERVALYEFSERGDDRSFHYRAAFKGGPADVWVRFAADGKLAAFHLKELTGATK